MLASVPAPFHPASAPVRPHLPSPDFDSPFYSSSSPLLSLNPRARLITRQSLVSTKSTNNNRPQPAPQDNARRGRPTSCEYPSPYFSLQRPRPSFDDRQAVSLASKYSLLRASRQTPGFTGLGTRAAPQPLGQWREGTPGDARFNIRDVNRKIVSMQNDCAGFFAGDEEFAEWDTEGEVDDHDYSEASDDDGSGGGNEMGQRTESMLTRLVRRKERPLRDDSDPLRGSIMYVKPPTIRERFGFGKGIQTESKSSNRAGKHWFLSIFRWHK